MTESERLIDETLRLDAEATKGPWTFNDRDEPESFDAPFGSTVCHFGARGRGWNGDDMGRSPDEQDANLIASYRSAAPRLARMLRVLLSQLREDECTWARAEIERIAKGEA